MKFLSLAPALGAICNFLLSIFVLLSDRRSRLNQVYFFWGLCITTWNACTYFLFTTGPEASDRALFWATVLQYGVIFLPVASLHLCLLVAEVSAPRALAILYLLHLCLAILHALGFFIEGVQHLEFAWYSKAGIGFWIYAAAFTQSTVAIWIMLKRRPGLAPLRRRRLDAMILAQTLIVVLGSNDLLPILGLKTYPFTDTRIYPYGSIAAIFYGIIVGYSVLQHQLLDVHIALGRNSAHIVRFGFLLLLGLAMQVTFTVLAPGEFTFFSFCSSLAVLVFSTLLASFLFPKLFGIPASRSDHSLHGDRFETPDRVRGFVENMIWYDDTDTLFDDLHSLLVRTLGIGSYKIILRDEFLHAFTIHRAHPPDDGAALPEIKVNSPIFQFFEWSKSEYLALSAKYARPGESNMGRLARRQFAVTGAEFAFPLTVQNEPFGLLLVGARANGTDFSGTDISMLVGLVKNLSLMVNQVRLRTQIRQNQDFELLGKMSRGMAHDLNNLLTPVSTLLQLATELGPGASLDDELLPMAMRNVKTMRAYIRESLFFSENLRPQLQQGPLDEVIRDAVATARSSRDKPVTIEVDAPVGVEIEMDAVLLQRLIANLVSNAIDASAPDSTIQVRLERLPRSEVSRDWVRLRVVDQGEGISKENLGRVQTPYFTTKNRGDSNRGFGLGLAICRKIANLHGGNLSIASQLKKGTTVQVDLPIRQMAPATPPVPLPA